MLQFIQQPNGQESIKGRDTKILSNEILTLTECAHTHVSKTVVSAIAMPILPYLPSTILKRNFFLPVILTLKTHSEWQQWELIRMAMNCFPWLHFSPRVPRGRLPPQSTGDPGQHLAQRFRMLESMMVGGKIKESPEEKTRMQLFW